MDAYFSSVMPLTASLDRANQNFDFTHSPYVTEGMQQYAVGDSVKVYICGVGSWEQSPFENFTFRD